MSSAVCFSRRRLSSIAVQFGFPSPCRDTILLKVPGNGRYHLYHLSMDPGLGFCYSCDTYGSNCSYQGVETRINTHGPMIYLGLNIGLIVLNSFSHMDVRLSMLPRVILLFLAETWTGSRDGRYPNLMSGFCHPNLGNMEEFTSCRKARERPAV